MNLFGIGFLFGMIFKSIATATPTKINDKVEYSCLWWGKEAERADLPKQKIACLLISAYHKSLVRKEHSDEGLCLFVPCSEEAKEEILEKISKCS